MSKLSIRATAALALLLAGAAQADRVAISALPAYHANAVNLLIDPNVTDVVANVAAGVVYSAARGQGARVRQWAVDDGAGTPLRCNPVERLEMALLATGFSYAHDKRRQQAQILTRILPVVRDIRRIGSCALDLCMVAAGQLDAYFEDGVHVWDWAAGALIAAEAGARVWLPGTVGAGRIAASAPGIATELTAALADAGVNL